MEGYAICHVFHSYEVLNFVRINICDLNLLTIVKFLEKVISNPNATLFSQGDGCAVNTIFMSMIL